jgi:protein involved in polysaccharide export with SLBB domain
MIKHKRSIPLFLLALIISGGASAQQIQTLPFASATPLPKPSGEAPSEFEQYVSDKPLAVSTDIKQFGYDLFRQPPSTFAPADRVPVGPDYVIGPGDEIRITVWGKVEGQWSLVVDRDGNVALPKAGVLGVTGLTFMELKDLLSKEFSKYYTGYEMNVSMGALRSIRVYVVGNAERPGAYTVSSLSTIVNAIFEAGGPGKTGTMRDIQLKRNGKTVVNFDLYDFLLKGDKTRDVRLMPEDVIFIPPVGTLAAIAGSVNKPAIYELKGESRISHLIEMAGGLSVTAFRGRVQIERISDSSRQVVFESNLDDIMDKDVAIQSGDVVKVFQVVEDRRTVRLSGAVHREGEYGFRPGMTVRELISMAGGLRYYAYRKEAELTRVHVTEKGPETEKILIDLEKTLAKNPGVDIPLKENDHLVVRSVPEWRLYRTVTVSGEVRFPGTYTIMKGERLSSVIERAGGFTGKAYLRGVAFTRESVRELQQRNLSDAIDRLEQQMLSQEAVSAQTALSPEEAAQQRAVAEQQRAIIAKMRAAKAQGRMVIRLDEMERFKGSPYDIELEEGDTLTIPERPNSVQVIGSVYNSTAFVYNPKETISSYIDKAGGTTKYAEEKEVFVLKSDGSAVARRQGGMFFMSSRLEPGDTVVVPEKVERIAVMREVKDLTQILYQIAVTAGVLIVAF